MLKRTIANYYDAEKFDKVIQNATLDLVISTMGVDADGEKGSLFVKQAAASLTERFLSLPVSYYMALEAFADNADLKFFKNSDEAVDIISSLNNGSFIDVVLACEDGKLSVKNEKESIDYYDALFPQSLTDFEKNSQIAEANVSPNGGKNIPRRENFIEMLEDIELKRAMSALEKANLDFKEWLKPEFSGQIDGTELKRFQKINSEIDKCNQRLDSIRQKAILSAQKRFTEGRLTQEQLVWRLDQIQTGSDILSKVNEIIADEYDPVVDMSDSKIHTDEVIAKEQSPIENTNKYRINFKERNIELGTYVPQTPIVQTNTTKHDPLEADEHINNM